MPPYHRQYRAQEALEPALTTHPIGFGSAAIGHLYEPVSDVQAHQTLAAAWSAGIRYFDTAPLYGHGAAERRVGEFLVAHPREQFVVSTKVGRLLTGPTGSDSTPTFDYSSAAIRRSLESSLQRLGLDHVDIALIHDPDDHWEQAVAEGVPELIRLREEGIVRAIGVGMNQTEMLSRFVAQTDIDCVLAAGRYTLLDRSAERELLPSCAERGVAVIAGGVFNGGILAEPNGDARYDYRPAPRAVLSRAHRLQAICAQFDVPLAAVALQFPLRHPAITTAVVGARSAEEMRDDILLLEMGIPDELWPVVAREIDHVAAVTS